MSASTEPTARELGWADLARDHPDVVALRRELEAGNGLRGLEIVEPHEVERAVRLFRRDGFVVVRDALDPVGTAQLQAACVEAVEAIVALDPTRSGNRGSHRYSFGGASTTRSQLHRPEWQMLVDLPTVTPILIEIFGSDQYMLRAASGDFCLPGAVNYQPLHADVGDFVSRERTPYSSFHDPLGHISLRDLPVPYVAVNFFPQAITRLNGPIRQIPCTQTSRAPLPTLADEPQWMRFSTVCPAPAGAALIRDVRAWHGGTPNLSDEVRSIPNVEFYAPWFREPVSPCISAADHARLSPHAQHLTRFLVAHPGDDLATGFTLHQPAERHIVRRLT